MLVADANFWMPSLDAVRAIGPLWGLVGTLVAILLAALVFGRSASVAATVALAGAAATAVLSWFAGRQTDLSAWSGFAPMGGAPMLLMDNFSVAYIFLLSLFLAAVTGLWITGVGVAPAASQPIIENAPEFFILLVGSAVGMALMTCTTNLLMIILAIEMASLPSYGIVGFLKGNRRSAEASLKYVLFGAVTSAMMIYGVSLLYGYYGTLDLVHIGRTIALQTPGGGELGGLNLAMAVAFFGLLAGIGFKISAVPFHFWCPDVFEGAAIEVTTWLSVASKAAGLGLCFRVIAALSQPMESTTALAPLAMGVGILAALTCTLGNLAAFWQKNLKRMLAYSSIAHAGYMLMAGAIHWRYSGSGPTTHPAFAALVAYVIAYLLMNLGAFSCVAMVFWATGRETVDAYSGLGRRAPLVALCLAVCLFSLVGLPPLAGFIAKFYLLGALAKQGLIWLVIVAVLNTLISLYYYARVAWAMYFTDDGQPAIETPLAGRALVATVAFVLAVAMTPLARGYLQRSEQYARQLYPVAQTVGAPVSDPPALANAARGVTP